MAHSAPLLEVELLCAGYGALQVLYDVSLHVQPREVVGLLGANGAGKTSLVRTICGLLPARAGTIRKSGLPLTGSAPHRRPLDGVAVVLEGRNLFGELSVGQNLALAERAGRRRITDRDRFTLGELRELFPVIGDKHGVPARLLSGGQQQMVAIARALLLQPDLLILDEPSTGLAPKVVKDIVRILQGLRGRGLGMILVEQNAAMAAELTDRAYVLKLGRVSHEIGRDGWADALRGGELVEAYLGRT